MIAQTTEAEVLGRRVQELLARLDEQGRFLAEREQSSDSLAQRSQLRAEDRGRPARRAGGGREPPPRLRPRRSAPSAPLLEEQLKQSQDERAKLQHEIATMKREVEATWATERMENAVLRERINDVAAEVARLTSALEGPGSPIDTILAATPPAAAPLAPAASCRRRHAQRRRLQGLARRPHPRAAKPRLARAAAEPRLICRWAQDGANRGVSVLDTAACTRRPCLKSCPRTGRLAQRESVPFTRERS